MSKKLTQKEVLERFTKVHGDKYDYSLVEYLKAKNVKSIDFVGLVTEYCVKFSVLDSINENFKTRVILKGIKGINIKESNKALDEMKSKGVDLL